MPVRYVNSLNVREDLAGRRIHRDERGVVDVVALEGVDVLTHFLLGKLLHVPVERCEDVVSTSVRRLFTEDLHELLANAEREPRRVQRGRHGLHDDLLDLCGIGFRRRHVAVVDHRVEHLGASRLRAVDVLARVVIGGRLRQAR